MKRSPMPPRHAAMRRTAFVSKTTSDREWPRTRKRTLIRDGGRCGRCGSVVAIITFDGFTNDRAHVHHVLPRSRGGKNDGSTPLLTLCLPCHVYVHDHPLESKEKGWLA